ncbi:MAG: aminotransferase class I/II-fold pyridoxal phosphate-dependent enzyme [Candidatus Thermoplasmatota archaeon]|nr:aminotransferase class I/II-fold pyridoxal phosphate-dependent enzyme [Candidatus Thermoplasmatota archaeon]MCL5437891.1 aminotransferase class I/II-fold pyridoxal phosphate-dependent enzyme [Candidatus Thermoplasmatota archaeon]
MKFSTRSIHVGEEPDIVNGTGDVVREIHLSTTFARKDPLEPTRGYEYTRTGNPTRQALEEKIASLEGGKHGLAFSSGLSAETVLFLSLLSPGDHVIASEDLYGGTERLLRTLVSRIGITYEMRDLSDASSLGSIPPNTKMVYFETPSNPLLRIIDIAEVSRIAKEHGSISVVDNTFASPYFQNPLEMGADVVVHSMTKYINGHSDSLGGALVTSNDDLYEGLKFNQNAIGAVMSPFDSYLTMRGLKTLSVRMDKHRENAEKLVRFLQGHEKIGTVYYPGLESHRNHAIASRQMRGYGGMISFTIDTDNAGIRNFASSTRYFALAESLGGVESLMEIPSLMTHAGIPREIRKKTGISDNLVRISVGIEDYDDLQEDLDHALGKV